MDAKEHQETIRQNIQYHESVGDTATANALREMFADLLAINLDENPDFKPGIIIEGL